MAIERTGTMSGGIALGLVLQLTISILRDDILIELDQVWVLGAAVGIVAGKTGGAILPPKLALDV